MCQLVNFSSADGSFCFTFEQNQASYFLMFSDFMLS